MPPAVAIAGVTAAATIGGSVLSSNAQKKAANQASDTALQVAQTNNATAERIYKQNKESLDPFVSRGNAAGDAINSLLGLGSSQSQQAAPQQPVQFNPFGGFSRNDLADIGFNNFTIPGLVGGFANNDYGATQAAPAPASDPQQDYEKAFDNYRNSTGYQFRVNEGNDSLNTGYAARGALRSGAAMKSLADFNQNIASNEFGNYLGQLSNQQGVGLAGASASAGVGNNYVSNVSANNNSAGTVAANAALARGQANSNLYGDIAGGLGKFLGSSF